MLINFNAKLRMTLLEVTVLLGAAAILASVLPPMMIFPSTCHPETEAKSDCIMIAMALEVYYADYGKFPTTSTEAIPLRGELLKVLAGNNPKKKVYYAGGDDFKNPWGLSYHVQLNQNYPDPTITEIGDKIKTPVAVWTKIDNGELIVSWE